MSTKTFTKTKRNTIPPPPTTPKLKLRRRKYPKPTTKHHGQEPINESPFHDQENQTNEAHCVLSNPIMSPRKLGTEEQKRMFQAELLRAECKMLRIERVSALKKLKENRVETETRLRSAIQTLKSGRTKISEGDNVTSDALNSEIENLAVKLQSLQKNSTTTVEHGEKSKLNDENKCSGRCKVVVQKILQQVVAETEQWSVMQEMLGRVRAEMEQIQSSRDYWENRARDSDHTIQYLRNHVNEWKAKARDYKHKANRLQLELNAIQEKYQRRKRDVDKKLKKQKKFTKENDYYYQRNEQTCKKDFALLSLGQQIAEEKKMILGRLKEMNVSREENDHCNRKKVETFEHSPLRDIVNYNPSTLVRDCGINLSFRSIEGCGLRERSFRK